MEHFNPLLRGASSPQKFITIGEIMLRLVPVFSDHIFEPSGTRFIEAGLRADAKVRKAVY